MNFQARIYEFKFTKEEQDTKRPTQFVPLEDYQFMEDVAFNALEGLSVLRKLLYAALARPGGDRGETWGGRCVSCGEPIRERSNIVVIGKPPQYKETYYCQNRKCWRGITRSMLLHEAYTVLYSNLWLSTMEDLGLIPPEGTTA